jgi:hypothetical protein
MRAVARLIAEMRELGLLLKFRHLISTKGTESKDQDSQ